MARSRNIKPGFFTNDDLGEMEPLARLLFAGMWTIADREGRLEDRPKKIKAEVLPYDNCDAEDFLSSLAQFGFIQRYEVAGKRYIQILAWGKHQNPHCKEAASTIPAPEGYATSTESEQHEHGASTVQAPCDSQPLPERAGLIPDSLNLIPDSSPLIPSEEASASKPARAPRKPTTNLEPLDLVAEGVELQHATDWRKARKSPITPTAWAELKTQAALAGITPGEAVRICAAKGWRGFDASWRWQGNARASPSSTSSTTAEAARILGFDLDETGVIDA